MFAQTMTDLDHDYMVREVVAHLSRQRFTGIRADVAEYQTPERIFWQATGQGHVPDVTATGTDGTGYVIEVESAADLESEHAQSQRRLFSANAAQHKKTFVLVVQSDLGSHAEALVKQERVQALVWTVRLGAV